MLHIIVTSFDPKKAGTKAHVTSNLFKKTDKGCTTVLCTHPIPKQGFHKFQTKYSEGASGGWAMIGIATDQADLGNWIKGENAWSYGGNGFTYINGNSALKNNTAEFYGGKKVSVQVNIEKGIL